MTRQQQREIKQQKKEALVQARVRQKELKKLNKSFDKMIAMAKSKNALIE